MILAVLSKARAWIARDWKRFVWEVAVAGVLASVSWGVGYFLNNRTLQSCQDEREVLLKQASEFQRVNDQLLYEGLLSAKDILISEKDDEILALKRKVASDSIQHMSDIDAIRAINQYIKEGNAGGRGRQREPG
ncbi:hypothetical protein [Spirosoma endbachense]|uniref:Uncharacterized protein n=1 Tax=Spirosoma endbachense TaxID=2666025 RepID=A0A6P1W2N4_9BACT|nr:hypothetical protein [Spirosoma endbachense]QHV97946.1 hypothetical protein GJR95_24350 [Spirosoma endbachense]